MHSVNESRKTLIILSKNFIESAWCRMEFRVAHYSALKEGRNRAVLVIYGDIGNMEFLDDELKAYIRGNNYVRWGEPFFWKKLQYLMPKSRQIMPRDC